MSKENIENWIEENKKQVTRQSIAIDKEKAQQIYDELENDSVFALPFDVVMEEFGFKRRPRSQTLQKWLLNAINRNKDYSLKVGESGQECYIFRRVE